VCDKTCIFFFFPIINKYFLMAKRPLLSRCPSYKPCSKNEFCRDDVWRLLVQVRLIQALKKRQ